MRFKKTSVAALLCLIPGVISAQEPAGKAAVISIQPINAMLTVYAAEAELAMSRSTTIGLGGTYWSPGVTDGDFNYASADLKVRYYPEGRAFQGFSFGGSVGVTHLSATDNNSGAGSASGPSIGVMLDYNWLLGAQKAFYVGLGLGAKTLFISDKSVADEATLHYPTMRLSVGWAF
ncbi:MAG TPA: DUF3575 domain-containing protein [Gemmatimonadaceae bacterium]|nr:DUF3575 domain-containing protein [Gemmatimonadaceae bacterium]